MDTAEPRTIEPLTQGSDMIGARIAAIIQDAAATREQFRMVSASLRETLTRVRDQAGISPYDAAFSTVPFPRSVSPTDVPLNELTAREIEVLRLIAEGYSTKEIAALLGITFKTAVTHRTKILFKLGVHESASLVRIAIRAGLVTP